MQYEEPRLIIINVDRADDQCLDNLRNIIGRFRGVGNIEFYDKSVHIECTMYTDADELKKAVVEWAAACNITVEFSEAYSTPTES